MKAVEAIDTVALFPPLSRELLAVLRALQPEEWALPTACSPWTVKDVAGHLLGGNLGRLWQPGERRESGPAVTDYDDLLRLIDYQNDLWVQASARIGPAMLIDLLELTDRRLYDYFRDLDAEAPAGAAVAWAGETVSPNWFDIAREYTEKWHHQQHIREAVGQPLLLDRRWLFPALDTFMRGLPHAYRASEAEDGTAVSVLVSGAAGGAWTVRRAGGAWQLLAGQDPHAACLVRVGQDAAWRLLTKGLTAAEIRREVTLHGVTALGEPLLAMISIMA